jgi:hypothetical protein
LPHPTDPASISRTQAFMLSRNHSVRRSPCPTPPALTLPTPLPPPQLPPGLDTWDPTSYLATTFPILMSVLGVNLVRRLIYIHLYNIQMNQTFIILCNKTVTVTVVLPGVHCWAGPAS